MKVFWNVLSSFVVPVGVLLAAMSVQGVPFDSTAALVVVVAFMTLKVVVQYFKFEPGRAFFAGVGQEGQFRIYASLIYTGMGLGTLQLFMLATH